MSAFYVKCSACGLIYDSKHIRCPECECNGIVKRIMWSKKDFETVDRLIKEEKE